MTLVSLNHCTSKLTLRYESKLLSLRVKKKNSQPSAQYACVDRRNSHVGMLNAREQVPICSYCAIAPNRISIHIQ